MERSLLRGLAAFRWAAWIWMATVLVLARLALVRPIVAVGLVAAALAVTVWATLRLRGGAARSSPAVVGAEVAVALALQLADGSVYRAPHVFQSEQPLGVGWPTAAILSAGVAGGPAVGAGTGVLLGVGRAVSSVANVVPDPAVDPFVLGLSPAQVLSLVTTTMLYVFAGAVAGYAAQLMRRAEARITTAERSLAEARAKEHLARRLHDGVLQTLALVERRTEDPALARLARDQERDLRGYLFDSDDEHVVGRGALGDALRELAGRHEAVHGGRVDVLVPDDLPDLAADVVAALTGAAGEAMANAATHGTAERIVVSAEPGDGPAGHVVTVSVRDDGTGFDPATTPEGVGRSRSIRGRIEEVGGDVEVVSRPGHGAEVRLRVPA